MCTEDQFGCILTAECIPISVVCDDVFDCSDASDEEYCTGKIQNRLHQRDFDFIHMYISSEMTLSSHFTLFILP